MASNLTYRQDPEADIWNDPIETLRHGYGDCEDLAILAARALKVLGFTPRLLLLSDHDEAHIICAIEDNGVIVIFDNQRMIKTGARSVKELARMLMATTSLTHCREIRVNDPLWNHKRRYQPTGILIARS